MKIILTALLKAQGEFPSIPRGKTANVPTKSGGSYSYSYADLGDVVDACQPILAKNELVLFQVGVVAEGKQALRTILGHSSGETIQSDFLLPFTDDCQDAGGNITYFRRYAQCAILGIVTEEDTDGQQKAKPRPLAVVPSDPNNPGAYVLQCGKKYAGQTLESIGVHDCVNYADWLKSEAQKKNKPLTGEFLAGVNAIEAFAKSREIRKV